MICNVFNRGGHTPETEYEAGQMMLHYACVVDKQKPRHPPSAAPLGSRGLTKKTVAAGLAQNMSHAEIAEQIGVSVEAVARFTKRFDLGGVA